MVAISWLGGRKPEKKQLTLEKSLTKFNKYGFMSAPWYRRESNPQEFEVIFDAFISTGR